MFSDERTVVVRTRGNGDIEHFVPSNKVEGEGDGGRVQVTVVDRVDGAWAELPTPYRRAVPVEQDQLIPA